MEKKIEATIQGLGLPKIRGIFLGVPIVRTIVFGGLYWGPYLGKLSNSTSRFPKTTEGSHRGRIRSSPHKPPVAAKSPCGKM